MPRMLPILVVLHAYIGMRLLPDLPFGLSGIVLGGLALAASAYLIPLGFRARRTRATRRGEWAMWGGLLAMGAFSTLLMLTFLRDAALLLVLALATWTELAVPIAAILRYSALAVPLLTTVITVVGYSNARRVAAVRHVDVPIDDLPQGLHGFTIAQISDLHIGPTIGQDHVEAVVDAVNGLAADMVAITGDLVDGTVRQC